MLRKRMVLALALTRQQKADDDPPGIKG